MKNEIFDEVLRINRRYVEAVDNNESAEVQESLLTQCEVAFKTMVVDAGLRKEYREYCEATMSRKER